MRVRGEELPVAIEMREEDPGTVHPPQRVECDCAVMTDRGKPCEAVTDPRITPFTPMLTDAILDDQMAFIDADIKAMTIHDADAVVQIDKRERLLDERASRHDMVNVFSYFHRPILSRVAVIRSFAGEQEAMSRWAAGRLY